MALSPMLEKYAPPLVKKFALGFPLLCDEGNRVAGEFGMVFDLDPQLIEVYKGFGIDLERYNGPGGWRLPLPGRVLIDRHGVVRDVQLFTDHTLRPEPAETLELLKRMTA